MTIGVDIKKHIQIRNDTIIPKDRRKKPYQSREYIVIDGHKYWYESKYINAEAAVSVAEKNYPGREWVIIPMSGWGNPGLPALFIAEAD